MSERRANASALGQVVQVAAFLGLPATVLTGLLVFFGWARAEAQARHMGLHVDLFGYSTRDYVLTSISALYLPLLGLVTGAMVWFWTDRRLHESLSRTQHPARAIRLCGVVVAGAVAACLALLVVAMTEPPGADLYVPGLMALAVLAAAWAVRIRRSLGPGPEHGSRARPRSPAESLLVLALVSLLLFWGTSGFAGAMGRQQAVQLELQVQQMPRARVHSTRPLGLTVPSVTEEVVAPPGGGAQGRPLYRYEGLRLLSVDGGRYFFLHDGWTVREGTVVVLPDDSSLWVEYRR
ncbi:hypothetical protein ACH9EU_10165 [Kocuria sp. M1R5S2]|uniref:hypothetical protein n=1 Tax=Kocuria rhizosphaerae TaxID=3376285 RepID=UPI0037953EEF